MIILSAAIIIALEVEPSMKLIRTGILTILTLSFVSSCAVQANAALFATMNLTTKEERELGKEFMIYVTKNRTLIKDPDIVEYVGKIGQRILAQHPSPPFEFNFYIVKEDVYNAFAAPAGHVFICSGLLGAMESEEELAGILSHEIAHVSSRHISERIARAKKIGLATLAGVLTGIFLGGGDVSAGIATGSIAAGQSLSLKFSRENEMEADQVGLKYLTKAGYTGNGLLDILGKIREKQWFGSGEIPSYLSTHPAVEARMAYLDTWIQTHPKHGTLSAPRDETKFNKVRAKVIALYGDKMSAHNTFDALLRKNDKDALALYGKGLVLGREGKRDEAVETLTMAAQLRPLDADILRDLGKAYFNMGDYVHALKTLRGALAFNAKDSEGHFLLGRAQMETGDLQGALKTFTRLLDTNPDYLQGTYYLGEVYGKLGNLAEAHYHLGMYYNKKQRLDNARFHLNRALKLFAKDPARQKAIKEALKGLEGHPRRDRSEKTAS